MLYGAGAILASYFDQLRKIMNIPYSQSGPQLINVSDAVRHSQKCLCLATTLIPGKAPGRL